MFESFFAIVNNVLSLTSGFESEECFPKPLNTEQEEVYLNAAEKGDERAVQALINHNMRLVVHIAKKYSNYPDMDELLSVGAIGLIKGVHSYKRNQGTALATYCARCIENEILMVLRSAKKRKNDISLNDVIGVDKEGNTMTLIELLPAEEEDCFDDAEKKANIARMHKGIQETLDEREYQVLVSRYGLYGHTKMPQREIAKRYGISRSYVSRIEKKAIDKLRKYLESD